MGFPLQTPSLEKGSKGLIKKNKSELNLINNQHAKRNIHLLSIFRLENPVKYVISGLDCYMFPHSLCRDPHSKEGSST